MEKHLTVKEKYIEAKATLASEYDIKNPFALPKIVKVVVNIGIGDLLKNQEGRDKLAGDIARITGQKPKLQAAKISVAGFGIRAGQPVGLTVTLRGKRMYDFLDKFISIVLPRLRDFRGVSAKSFDKQGNYTIGLTEHTVFPEVDITKVDRPSGLEITIVTSAKDPDRARRLLELIGLPFEKERE
jgi:large subunit ribosomal protein L5